MSPFSTISPRHMELLAAVVKNLKSTDVDWETVAADANYKTAKYARDEYAKAWKKLQTGASSNKDKDSGTAAEEGVAAADATTATATPKTKKRKAAVEKTPAKGKKPKKSEAAVDEAAEDDAETQVKPEPQADDGEVSEEAADADAFS